MVSDDLTQTEAAAEHRGRVKPNPPPAKAAVLFRGAQETHVLISAWKEGMGHRTEKILARKNSASFFSC